MKSLLTVAVAVTLFMIWADRSQAAATHVVINEIRSTGASSASDEFIELYNPTGASVNLTGWSLSRYSGSGTKYPLLSSFPSGTAIAAGSYVLVAPQADLYPGPADVRYPKSYSIADSNSIELLDGGKNSVDLVGYGTVAKFEGAAAVNPLKGSSIGRLDGIDTDKNAVDFYAMDSSPKAANIIVPPEPTEDSTPIDYGAFHISISELYPNPVGADADQEFIELANLDTVDRDISGFKLRDEYLKGKSSAYILPAGSIIPAGSFLTLDYAADKITLNNTGDTIELLNPADQVVSATGNYGTAAEGVSFAWDGSAFRWTTTVTPDDTNILTDPIAAVKSTKSSTAVLKAKVKSASAKASTKSASAGLAKDTNAEPMGTENGTTADTPKTMGFILIIGSLFVGLGSTFGGGISFAKIRDKITALFRRAG